MVVSNKEAKRKRKDSSSIIESSPEIPKRTKIQAQRKFAQGVPVPTSSHSIGLLNNSSTAGNSSTSNNDQPPTDLLPNHKPKPTDFITYLCFRNSNVLPPHLDYFKQNTPPENDDVNKKTEDKKKEDKEKSIEETSTPQPEKRNGRGRPKKSVTATVSKPSTSTAASIETTSTPEKKPESTSVPSSPLTFAVRKRAEKVADGTRKGRPPKTANRKSTRRSGTSSYAESDEEDYEEEEYEKSPSPAPSVKGKRKSAPAASSTSKETTSARKPAETPPPTKKEKTEVFTAPTPPPPSKSSTPISVDKEKPKGRRPRNRESPIFVPPPEGRMTRTRAFFEPVKVPPKIEKSAESSTEEEKTPEKKKNISDLEEVKSPEPVVEKKKGGKPIKAKQQEEKEEVEEKKTKLNDDENKSAKQKQSKNNSKILIEEKTSKDDKQSKDKSVKQISKEEKQDTQNSINASKNEEEPLKEDKDVQPPKKVGRSLLKIDNAVVSKPNKTEERKASGIHVFDFSSDDEEPLASTAAAEKKKAATKKPTPLKKPATPKTKKVEEEVKEKEEPPKLRPGRKRKSETPKVEEKSESSDEDDDVKSTLTRKNNSRKSRASLKKPVEKSESEEETRRPRPTRKTKEAANIYMELIGQKLNLENFDDDNMSMESYPELPNVKETEKMETELKSIAEKAKRDEQEKEKCKEKEKIKEKEKTKEKAKEKEKEKLKEKDKAKEKEKAKGKEVEKEKEKEKETEKEKEKEKESEKEKLKEKEEKEKDKATPPQTQGRRGRPPKKSKPQQTTVEVKENATNLNKNEEEEDFLLKEELNETKRKLEKSFSDSDDEPLAVKITTTTEKKAETTPQTNTTKVENTPPTLMPSKLNLPALTPPTKVTPLPSEPSTSSMQILSPTSTTTNRFENKAKFSPSIVSTPSNFTPRLPQPKYHTPPTTYPPPIEAYPAPKINPNFLTPKFDRNHDRSRISSNLDSPYSSSVHKNLTFPSPSPLKIDSNSTPKSTCSPSGKAAALATPAKTDPLKDEIGSILAASLLPNREETNKIFGIASVTLAQSSGPDNTKCTLGKCGQVHKPPLGPVVPTESFLGEQLSSKERRKAKVNMTHEQIQKWLIECSSNPDEIDDDLDDDFSDLKPQTFSTTPPPHHRDDKESTSSSSKNTRDLGKSESVWSGKGPSLKATPVLIKETDKRDESTDRDMEVFSNSGRANKINPKAKRDDAIKGQPTSAATDLSIKNQAPPSSYTPPKVQKKNTIYSRNKEEPKVDPKEKEIKGKEKVVEPEVKDKEKNFKDKGVSLSLNPDESNKAVKVTLDSKEKDSPPPPTGQQKKKATPSGSKPTDKPSEILLNAGDSDDEGHTYYIPLDASSFVPGSGLKSDMIQGVAVKLGREGPSGPNQKVIMRATLVTKSQMESNSNSAPEANNSAEVAAKKLDLPKPTAQPSTSTSPPKSKAKEETSTPPPLTRVNSNSSLFSGSNKSKSALPAQPAPASLKKFKDDSPVKMANNTAFPRHDDPTQMVEAPIFRPTEKEFQDPMEFIERITPLAARFGICKIIPPASFKPECRVSDDMRFTAYNQYVHKMLHRWGPSAKELSAIKKYLSTQDIVMNHPPWIGGMEVDLPRLYHTVQELGGLKEVIEKKKWVLVAEKMCIPKLAQDRVTKLDDIYCKYLLPYDTLSQTERQKLFDEVEADWAKREARARRNADRFVNTESVSNEEDEVSTDDEDESEEEIDVVSMECIVKGRNMPLSQFFRIARNTMALWFQKTPTSTEIERDFWHHVAVRDSHVCVHSGSIDSSGWGYGFPTPGPKGKGSVCAKHPWNLKVLTNNPGSVLRSLGPVIGGTVPTLHVGMVFSACCWYRDPHGLSWIEYLHTGASKIWYGIPDDQSVNFRQALTQLIPTHCQNKTLWLPSDTAMVPPYMLTERGVSLCRIEQKPGEFVVIFPRAYTSSIATGYVVSESVYFATSSWLDFAKDDFKDIHDSCEPAMFSLEQLLFALAGDQRITSEIISQIIPMMGEVYDKEVAAREQLKAAGVTSTEKIVSEKAQKSKSKQVVPEEYLCETCRSNLYISMVRTDDNNIYCLQHALKNLNKGNIQAKQCKLIFSYNIEDIETLIKSLKDKLSQKKTTVVANCSKKFPSGSK